MCDVTEGKDKKKMKRFQYMAQPGRVIKQV
jgi:hypothetical protein